MNRTVLLPMLSEADPKTRAEGSIDPLGMYAIADVLAVRLVPGVRERQRHPRFLTSIAVSLSLCSGFSDDEIAADGISEPWQVFEWYVVEGLVRTMKDPDLLRGLPGQNKARNAIQDGVPLCARRYLKTPTVFGFHGVYRALARDTNVDLANHLGSTGYDLLNAWERDQELHGFTGSGDGPGKVVRHRLLDAVRDGLEKGAVARKAGWSGWNFFGDHLGIYEAGGREVQVIKRALLHSATGYRREVMSALLSDDGRVLWAEQVNAETYSERRFHELLLSNSDGELRDLLRAIDAYEQFSRLLQDAFDDCLFHLSKHRKRVQPSAFVQLEGVQRAAAKIPSIFSEVADRISPFGEAMRFHELFGTLAEKVSPLEWVERLLEHHRRVQSLKPPAGKAPWLERFDDGSYLIRTAYLRDSGGRHDDSYVHTYRTKSLWSFARDLHLVE